MNQLIIYSHYSPFSFNCAIKDLLKEEASKLGVSTVLRDLYHMQFNPILDNKDICEFNKGNIPKDVLCEQKYILEADIIIFVFPVWWNSFPAMIKGYLDRVFSRGFAYDYNEEGGIIPLLKEKRVVTFNTLGGKPKSDYINAFSSILDMGIFDFCGLNIDFHKNYPEISSVEESIRLEYLEDVRKEYIDIINKKTLK
jgi:NAD(P)H dehydrogenase (quinone)